MLAVAHQPRNNSLVSGASIQDLVDRLHLHDVKLSGCPKHPGHHIIQLHRHWVRLDLRLLHQHLVNLPGTQTTLQWQCYSISFYENMTMLLHLSMEIVNVTPSLYGNMKTLLHCSMEIWLYSIALWKYENVTPSLYGNMKTLLHRSMEIWQCQSISLWKYDNVNPSLHGNVTMSIHLFMKIW